MRSLRVCSGPALALLVLAGCGSHASPVAPTAPGSAAGPATGPSVQIGGLVGAVAGACPTITFAAGPRIVTTDAATSFGSGACTDVIRSAVVDVEGPEVEFGIVLARSVRVGSDGPDRAGLLSDVAAGGYVLFFRHAERNAGAISTSDLAVADNLGACVPGSELTAAGQADAVRLGERFRRYGIGVQRVHASPTCRTTQMAQLAFGSFETTRALTWAGMWTPEEQDSLAPAIRALLATPPGAGTNVVLIAHNDVLRSARVGVDVTLDQAEAAVFRPLGGDRFEFLGKIPKAEWMGRQ